MQVVLSAVISACGLLTGGSAMADAIDDFVNQELVKQRIPGVSVGIMHHGELVRAAGYGDILAKRVFGPLHMTTARVISDRDIVPNRAAGYDVTETGLLNQE